MDRLYYCYEENYCLKTIVYNVDWESDYAVQTILCHGSSQFSNYRKSLTVLNLLVCEMSEQKRKKNYV